MAFARDGQANPIYGTPQHRRARSALIAAWQPGDPCCLCGHPMWGPTSALHADHQPGTTDYRGLAHAHCNTRDGAKRGRARQEARVTQLEW